MHTHTTTLLPPTWHFVTHGPIAATADAPAGHSKPERTSASTRTQPAICCRQASQVRARVPGSPMLPPPSHPTHASYHARRLRGLRSERPVVSARVYRCASRLLSSAAAPQHPPFQLLRCFHQLPMHPPTSRPLGGARARAPCSHPSHAASMHRRAHPSESFPLQGSSGSWRCFHSSARRQTMLRDARLLGLVVERRVDRLSVYSLWERPHVLKDNP